MGNDLKYCTNFWYFYFKNYVNLGHRDYESLYLGVIPVIINNKFTNMNNHVQYMRSLNFPFYEIRTESLDRFSDEFFDETLYKKIIQECRSSIYNLPQLKLSYYSWIK